MNSELRTSYILTKHETIYLIGCIRGAEQSPSFNYLYKEFLSDEYPPPETVDGLIEKKLVRKVFGGILLEPVVDFLLRSAVSADAAWIFEDGNTPVTLVLKLRNFFMLVSSYSHINGSWKIAPYQNIEVLNDDLAFGAVTRAVYIDKNGKPEQFHLNGGVSWIKGGEE